MQLDGNKVTNYKNDKTKKVDSSSVKDDKEQK